MKNAALFAQFSPAPVPGENGINRYSGKQREYFEAPTSAFIWENAKYSSNYFQAKVQGVIPGTFETERGAYIRSQDIVEQTTGAKMPNDYQCIYFQDTRIKGLYTGAKVKYAGNTWLAISPFNIADPMTQAVIRRCNAVWKYLDYYGNVKSEPFVFHDGRASATANEYLDWDVIPNWYQKCVMQLNDDTRELAFNRRIVLGSSVVEVRGLVDFITDFTGTDKEGNENPEPSHVMFFDVQYQQPIETDDMENGIAGGKAFNWIIQPSFSEQMTVGSEQTITAESLRNSEPVDTEKHPVNYRFISNDPSIVSVDRNGKVTANTAGSGTITIALVQNPNITAEITINVSVNEITPEIVLKPELPEKLRQMQTYKGKASLMRGGTEIETEIQMQVYGGKEAADADMDANTGEITITCYEASNIPLSLVFKAEAYSITLTRVIQLEGY